MRKPARRCDGFLRRLVSHALSLPQRSGGKRFPLKAINGLVASNSSKSESHNPSHTIQIAEPKGSIHEHGTLRLSGEPAGHQGDGRRQSPRPRLDDACARSAQGRAHVARLCRTQSQLSHADLQGRRLRVVGIQRHHAVSRFEEGAERSAAGRREGTARRHAGSSGISPIGTPPAPCSSSNIS